MSKLWEISRFLQASVVLHPRLQHDLFLQPCPFGGLFMHLEDSNQWRNNHILLEIDTIFASLKPSTFNIPLQKFTKDGSYLEVPQSKFPVLLSIGSAPTTHTVHLGKVDCQCQLHCLVMHWKLKHLPFGVTLYLHSLLRYVFLVCMVGRKCGGNKFLCNRAFLYLNELTITTFPTNANTITNVITLRLYSNEFSICFHHLGSMEHYEVTI